MIVWDESGCMDISLTSTRWWRWHWRKSPNLISFLKCSDILKWVNWIDRVIEAHLLNLVLISVWSWTPSGSTWANTLTLNKLLYWLSLKKSAIAHKAVIFFFYKGEWNDAFVDQFFTVGQRERDEGSIERTCSLLLRRAASWLKSYCRGYSVEADNSWRVSRASHAEAFDSPSPVTLMYSDCISSNKWYIECFI